MLLFSAINYDLRKIVQLPLPPFYPSRTAGDEAKMLPNKAKWAENKKAFPLAEKGL
jgi:hypothetical protein